jgi:hypothetical protein
LGQSLEVDILPDGTIILLLPQLILPNPYYTLRFIPPPNDVIDMMSIIVCGFSEWLFNVLRL